MTTNNRSKKGTDWNKVAAIVALLTLLVTLVIYLIDKNVFNPFSIFKPRFDFEFEGIDSGENLYYEVSEDLLASTDAVGELEIVINSKYAGDLYGGPVIVYLKAISGYKKEFGRWDNFRNSHDKPILLKLNPTQLRELAFFPGQWYLNNDSFERLNSQGYITGKFWIEIHYLSENDQLLAEKEVTVGYQPWYHSTAISEATITEPLQLKIASTLINLGEPSKFTFFYQIYDITSIDTNKLSVSNVEWSPEENSTFPLVYKNGLIIDKAVEWNAEYKIIEKINTKDLKPGHVYMIETFFIKAFCNQVFKPIGTLETQGNPNYYRCKDQSQYTTFFYLNK